ncbi:MAG: DUF5916 domain-containing protein [Bacteroidales bacterium]|nr:DUF5916 domain-containing protein [Bacteroidales bacterium]
MNKRFALLLIVLFIWNTSTKAQQNLVNRDSYKLHISKTQSVIEIDGVLDDAVWKEAEKTGLFSRILPIDTGYASAQTEVMMCYDDVNVYLAVICHDTLPGKRPIESLRRDFSFGRNDNFIAFIDTYNDQTNGFAFGISSAGAQWDGIQANGGYVSLDWDCKWRSAVQNYPDRWVAEFSIPFRSIRYNEGDTEWGINFSRMDLKMNEKSSWGPVPRQFQSANLAFTGSLIWDEPLPEAGVRLSLIPYVSAKVVQDIEDENKTTFKPGVGGDAKITFSTSMNLDLTFNPDYSQVEVDRQVTNLDRFELFFPEKRQFFLENSDLFAGLGKEYIRPFFSRRIGLDSPVRVGGRLSGKIGENFRLGLMDLQTGTKDTIPASNYSVIAVQQKIFSRSNIGAFLVNKQVTNIPVDSSFNGNKYNRVAGVDFNLATADNRWTGKAFYHQAFYPNARNDAFAMAGMVSYNTQNLAISYDQAYVGSNYQAEVGFVPRKGYNQIIPTLGYKFFPSSERVANHGPGVEAVIFFKPDFSLTDRDIEINYGIVWLNRSSLSVELENTYLMLQEPFDPTNTGGDSLAAGTDYNWNEVGFMFSSDTRKLFNYAISSRYGGYFNGTRFNVSGEINYRVQPYGSLSIVASYNKIDMPQPYNSAELILIGPRLDITFTDKIFFTTFVQYNNQIDNVNINLRFQWRFAPVSDLYIVYTSNSYPEDFYTKNRALVVKLSYWFN